jgi:hypothetical protein
MRKKHFDEEIYKRISVNSLILFSVYLAVGDKNKCDFEKLINRGFVLFPKAFSFPGISKWPDSRKFDRPLRALRKKKLIVGNPKTFFSLTKAGKKAAEEIAKTFRQKKLKL